MADPFSIFAAAAALAGEGLKLSKTIYTFVKEVKGSDDEANRFVDEIKVTSACLHQFGNNVHTMTEQETRYFHPDFFEKTKECVASCQDIFGQLRTSISEAVPGIIFQTGDPVDFIMRKRDQLSWPFTRIQIVSTSKQLRKAKADLHLLVDLMMFTCNQQREKEERQRRIRHDTVRARQKRIESKILETKFMNLKLERDLAECALDDPVDFYEEPKARRDNSAANNDFANFDHAFGDKLWGAESQQPLGNPGLGRQAYPPSDRPPNDLDQNSGPQKSSENLMANGIGSSGPQRMAQADIQADNGPQSDLIQNSHQNGASGDPLKASKSTQTPELDIENIAAVGISQQAKESSKDLNSAPSAQSDKTAKRGHGKTKAERPESRFWRRFKSTKAAAQTSADTTIDNDTSFDDPRIVYDARIWRSTMDSKDSGGWKEETLPYSREEIITIVQIFQSKRKSVAERYDRFGDDLRKSIKRYMDDINHMLVERWSIAAILIAPKRARYIDIDSATIVFWWRPTDPAMPKAMRGVGRDETVRLPQFLKLKDAVGRSFVIPWEVASTWKGIRQVIEQAFLHIDVIGDHVLAGHYDLLDPGGAIILPNLWEKIIRPGWTVSMHLWPSPDAKRKEEPAKKDPKGTSKTTKSRKERPSTGPPEEQLDERIASRTQEPDYDDLPRPPPPAMPHMAPPPPDMIPGTSYQQPGPRVSPPGPYFENDQNAYAKRRSGRKRASPRGAGASILQWAAGGGIKRKQSPPRVTELSDTDSSGDYALRARDDDGPPVALATTNIRRGENWADMQRDRNQANWKRLVRKEGDSLQRLLDRSTESPHDLMQLQEEHKKLRGMMYGQPDPLRDLMRQYTVLDVDGEKQDEDGQEDQQRQLVVTSTIPEESDEDANAGPPADGGAPEKDYLV